VVGLLTQFNSSI